MSIGLNSLPQSNQYFKSEDEMDRPELAEHIKRLSKNTFFKRNFPFEHEDRIHPLYEQVQRGTKKWLKAFNIITDKKIREMTARAYGTFTCKIHPQGALESVQIVSDFANWLFLYDDEVEDVEGIEDDGNEHAKVKARIEALHARSIEILNGSEIREDDSALTKGLHDIMQRIDRIADQIWKDPLEYRVWKERFVKDIKLYFESTLWETPYRLEKRIPSLEDYINERPKFSGTWIMFDFIELVEGITIPNEIFKTELFQQIRLTGANLVNWPNDAIFSAYKEFLKEDVQNLIFVLKQQHKITYKEAFEEGGKLIDKELARFENLRKKVENRNNNVKIYLNGIFNWLSGHHFWALKAIERYKIDFTQQ